MGKKQIERLLEQLKENQQKDVQNAAQIYTVAQVAVTQLAEHSTEGSTVAKPALAAASSQWSKAQLEKTFGSYNACRSKAKAQGIQFKRTPTWNQLVAAFNYADAFQQLIYQYLDQHPTPHLKHVTFTLGDRR